MNVKFPEPDESKLSPNERAVLDYIRKNAGRNLASIMLDNNLSVTESASAVRKLYYAGLVRSDNTYTRFYPMGRTQ